MGVHSRKKKRTAESINAQLQLVVKSGKYTLGFRRVLRSVHRREARMLLIAKNTPKLQRAQLEYYAALSRLVLHPYAGNNSALGNACGRPFGVGCMSVEDAGDSDILKIASGDEGKKPKDKKKKKQAKASA